MAAKRKIIHISMPDTQGIELSVVVPVYNEEGAVANLHAEILAAAKELNKPFEVIFVNDGSSDKTLTALKGLSPIKIVNFRKNFGQTAAMDAGIKAAQGKYIMTLDGDGQNDPAALGQLIEKLEADDLDVVSGWRRNRHDTFFKKFASRCAALLRRFLINDGIHDSGCSLKLYRRDCFTGIDLYGEMHRFIPALLKIRGFRIGEIEVNHRPRTTGKTKYNICRGVKGGLDMVAVWFWKKYANRPLHLFGATGLMLIIISVVAGLWAGYRRIFQNQDLSDTALTTLCIVAFVGGIQLVIFGLLADMLSKNYYAIRKRQAYNIREVIEH